MGALEGGGEDTSAEREVGEFGEDGDKIGEYFFSMEVGRGPRGDVLFGNALMAFRTSVGETGGSA